MLAGKIVSPNGFLGKVVFRAMASKFNRERFFEKVKVVVDETL